MYKIMERCFPSVPEPEEAKPAKASKPKATSKINWVRRCRRSTRILDFVRKLSIQDIRREADTLKKRRKLSEVEIIAELEKTNKRLIKPHLYSKLPEGLVKDILHLRNKKVTLALEQIRYEEWLHGQGKRRRRVLERLRKETALLDKKAAQRAISIQGSLVSPSQDQEMNLASKDI